MSAKSVRRMADKTPRAAYCTGCGVVFPKMHLLFNHRNTQQCGGRFLPEDERSLYNKAKAFREGMDASERANEADSYRLNWHNHNDCISRAYMLRKVRLANGEN